MGMAVGGRVFPQMSTAGSKDTCLREGCSNAASSTCGRCQIMRYCGKDCQQFDWPEHKVGCKVLRKVADAGMSARNCLEASRRSPDPAQFFKMIEDTLEGRLDIDKEASRVHDSGGHGHSHGGMPCHGHGHGHEEEEHEEVVAVSPARRAGSSHGHSHGGMPCHGHGH